MIKAALIIMKVELLFTNRKAVFYDNFVSFWMRQLGCVIPNIHITLDHFPVTLDISNHFGQCHKKPCFLLVIVLFSSLIS